MIVAKKLGICMDHATAHLIEFTTDPIESKSIDSKFTREEKTDTMGRSEHVMHNKEQHLQAEYYKKLAEVIKGYTHVILFGPTDAKTQLLNIINDDHHFSMIKIRIKQTDKMTENQQHAFVKNYFTES